MEPNIIHSNTLKLECSKGPTKDFKSHWLIFRKENTTSAKFCELDIVPDKNKSIRITVALEDTKKSIIKYLEEALDVIFAWTIFERADTEHFIVSTDTLEAKQRAELETKCSAIVYVNGSEVEYQFDADDVRCNSSDVSFDLSEDENLRVIRTAGMSGSVFLTYNAASLEEQA